MMSNDFSSSDRASTSAKDVCATEKLANKEHLWKAMVVDSRAMIHYYFSFFFFLVPFQKKLSSTPYSDIREINKELCVQLG